MAGVNTYGYMRRLSLAAVAAAALIGPANAFTVGTEPLGGINDTLGAGISGYYGANLFATGPLTITYTIVGYESGFANTFNSGVGSLGPVSGQAGTLSAPVGGPGVSGNILAGLLNFNFTTSGGGAADVNGANPDGTVSSAPNFFVSFFDSSGNQTNATHLGAFGGGTAGIIAFDDGGGARAGFPSDGDYDDLVIKFQVTGNGRIAPVPEASSWAMLLIGFAGLGFLAYRRKPNVTFRLV
jgi:hypothetical protein